jgi:GxxExxY protein
MSGENSSLPNSELNRITEAVIGAAIEVHRLLGAGFREPVYQNALEIELAERGIPFLRQHLVDVFYEGRKVGRGKLDFVIAEQVIVELKAVELIHPVHIAQTLSYLKTTGCKLGLVLNFNAAVLKDGIKRVIS